MSPLLFNLLAVACWVLLAAIIALGVLPVGRRYVRERHFRRMDTWKQELRLFLFLHLFGTFISMAAVYLEDLSYHRYRRAGEVARLLFVSLFDYFPYRLIISLFRIQGIFDFFRQRAGWGELQRRGFSEPERAAARPA